MPHLYDFSATDGSDRDLLGGKGAGLARMTSLGLPVPPGFTITTDVCRAAMANDAMPDDLWPEVEDAIARLEKTSGRNLGSGPAPLLLSVRSGAKFSMPGMMDTVLNLGINDDVVKALIEWSGDPHFGWDAYRRFVQMYGDVVLGVPEHLFQDVLTELRRSRGVEDDSELSAEDLETATTRFRDIVEQERPGELPEDPMEQVKGAITAVFLSWNTKRAVEYRRIHSIPDDLGTAANIQMMVFGDLGDDSGTGVCFTRDPGTGEKVIYGDYLPRAQGEDVVAGIRNTLTLDQLADLHPECHRQLLEIMDGLETHYRDMCDIEFTIERDVLYILQTQSREENGCGRGEDGRSHGRRGSHRPGDRGHQGRACLSGTTAPPPDRRSSQGIRTARGRRGRVPRRRHREGGLLLRGGGGAGTERGGGHPGSTGNDPGRHPRHGGGGRHPHQPGGQDITCCRGGSGHGQTRHHRGGQAAGRFRGGHRLHRECRCPTW